MKVQMTWTETGPVFWSCTRGWGLLIDADRITDPNLFYPVPPASSSPIYTIELEEAEAIVDGDVGGVSIFTGEPIY